MADIYDEMAEMAAELLAPTSQDGLGQGVIVLSKPGSTTPPANPWEPPIVVEPETHTLKATAKGVSKEFVNGTTILATDIEITAAAFGADPDPADTLTIDGKVVTVVKIMRLPAAGTLVAWKWVVRA